MTGLSKKHHVFCMSVIMMMMTVIMMMKVEITVTMNMPVKKLPLRGGVIISKLNTVGIAV